MQRWFSVLSHLNKMAGTFPWQINELIHYVINQLIEQLIDYDYFSGVCFCSCHTKFIITMKAQTHLTATHELQTINELYYVISNYLISKYSRRSDQKFAQTVKEPQKSNHETQQNRQIIN